MNSGRIESFGKPYDMITDQLSPLSEMLNSLEKFERDRLIEIARNAANSSFSTSSTLSPNSTSSSTSRNILDTSNSPLTTDPDLDDSEEQNLLQKIV